MTMTAFCWLLSLSLNLPCNVFCCGKIGAHIHKRSRTNSCIVSCEKVDVINVTLKGCSFWSKLLVIHTYDDAMKATQEHNLHAHSQRTRPFNSCCAASELPLPTLLIIDIIVIVTRMTQLECGILRCLGSMKQAAINGTVHFQVNECCA